MTGPVKRPQYAPPRPADAGLLRRVEALEEEVRTKANATMLGGISNALNHKASVNAVEALEERLSRLEGE